MKNIKNYLNELNKVVKKINLSKIKKIENIIFNTIKNDKKIFVGGNGGSASIANHFLCDFNKGIKISSKNKLKPKIISLSNNMETILAISNDISFKKIFSFQLDSYYKEGDIVILLSCSGSSPNIIEALKYCKKNKIYTISLTGFAKKSTQTKANLNLNFGVKNYGISEDLFQIIMHIISQNIRRKFLKKNSKTIL